MTAAPGSAGSPVRVVTAYRSAYPEPLEVLAGDEVLVGQRDSEWPAFLWCVAADGGAGWVPEGILARDGDRAILREDYSARELTVQTGERLLVVRREGGWAWVRNEQGESGWVPERHLTRCG